MKKNINILILAAISILFYSCEKDNLDFAPDASIGGEVRDFETGELVQQDILDGSKIYFIEQGWANSPVQSMVFKNDGTYQNNLIFSGKYKIILNRGNYIPQDTIDYTIKGGANKLSLDVIPYIRIINPIVSLKGDKVVAKFRLQQTTQNPVKTIALFAHPDVQVGYPIQIARETYDLNEVVNVDEEYELTIDLNKHSAIKRGNSYYFRIGAVSTASEAKYNYTTPINIDL